MGPKTAKPTPAAGSSKDRQGATGGGQEPTDAKESITWTTTQGPSGAKTSRPTITWPNRKEEQLPEFPDIRILRDDIPKVDSGPMSLVSYFSMFVSYDWYETDGRKLTREDVHGIMCMVFYGPKHYQKGAIYDNFDHPDPNRGVVTLRNVHDKFRAAWILQVDSWYKVLKETDPATEARNKALNGFPGRMPPMRFNHSHGPKLNKTELEPYQICTHHAVLKLGKTRENKDITPANQRGILHHYYGLKGGGDFSLSKTLADRNNETTIQTDLIVVTCEEWFESAANKVIEAWEVDVVGMEPRNKDATASQSNRIPVTTADFAAMTIGATADNPYGLTQHERDHNMRPIDDPGWKGKGKETLEFDDYLDPDAYAGSGPEEAPPAAGGGRGTEQSRRAKRSQRESTSGSREEEGGSKKGKQAVGKKRREKK